MNGYRGQAEAGISEAGPQVVRRTGRNVHLAETVVFLDGLSGTGKTMMGPILSSFDRVEVQRMDHTYDYLCTMQFLGQIEPEAVVTLLRLHTDLVIYNAMLGRESNFRWKDLSGVLNNPRGWRYLRRLLYPDGAPVIERIKQDRPVLQIHIHQLLGIAQPLFAAFGERLRYVEMVRHPLYLVDFWLSWSERFCNVPQDFNLWLQYGEAQLPWFVAGWEERYLASGPMDRTIYIIDSLTRRAEETLGAMDVGTRRRVLVIPFERFVVDPEPYVGRLERLLGTGRTATTPGELRRQKVPRKLWTDGRDVGVYRRYNWRPPTRDDSEEAERQRRWEAIARQASPEGMHVLERLCTEYKSRHLRETSDAQPEGSV